MIFKIENVEIFFKAGKRSNFREPFVKVCLLLEGGRRKYYYAYQTFPNISQAFSVTHIELSEQQLSEDKSLVNPKFLKYV